MKSKTTAAAAALLCALLTACGGGGNGSLPLGAQVSGLDRSGLQLQNGSETLDVPGSGNYYFTTLLAPDAAFNVTLKTVPSGTKCTISNNTGKINYYTTLQTTVVCVADPYTLGGSISGLSGSGLVLANGAVTLSVPAGATSFEFPVKVANQAPYGVTVLAQPAGQTCTIANATGTMPQANVSNLAVTCH